MTQYQQQEWTGEIPEPPTTYPGTLRGYREFKLYQKPDKAMSSLGPTGFTSAVYPEPDAEGFMKAKCTLTKYVDSNQIRLFSTDASFGQTAPVHLTSAPEKGCKCGFYVNYLPWQTFHQVLSRACNVHAVVETSDKVILSTKGYRAAKMRILAYWIPEKRRSDKFNLQALAKAEQFDSLDKMYNAFPQEDLTSLVGEYNYAVLQANAYKEAQIFRAVLEASNDHEARKLLHQYDPVTYAPADYCACAACAVYSFDEARASSIHTWGVNSYNTTYTNNPTLYECYCGDVVNCMQCGDRCRNSIVSSGCGYPYCSHCDPYSYMARLSRFSHRTCFCNKFNCANCQAGHYLYAIYTGASYSMPGPTVLANPKCHFPYCLWD